MLCPTLIFSHRRHNIEKKFTAKMITPLLLSLQIDSTLRADHGLSHAVKSKKLGWRNLTMEMIRDLEKLKRRYSERICFFFSYRWRNETCFCFLFLFKLKPFRFVLLLSPSGDLGIGLVWDNHPHPTAAFWSDCWNPLQTELNYLWWVLSCSQDDIRWFEMFSIVLSCFPMFSAGLELLWITTSYCATHNHPLCGHFFSGYPQLITDILSRFSYVFKILGQSRPTAGKA